jgi:hypothetical protein
MKKTVLERYKSWKYSHKRLIDGTASILMFYGVLFLFALFASADAICNRWMPFCIGWFD